MLVQMSMLQQFVQERKMWATLASSAGHALGEECALQQVTCSLLLVYEALCSACDHTLLHAVQKDAACACSGSMPKH